MPRENTSKPSAHHIGDFVWGYSYCAVSLAVRIRQGVQASAIRQPVRTTRRHKIEHDSSLRRQETMLLNETVLHGRHVIIEPRKVRSVQELRLGDVGNVVVSADVVRTQCRIEYPRIHGHDLTVFRDSQIKLSHGTDIQPLAGAPILPVENRLKVPRSI